MAHGYEQYDTTMFNTDDSNTFRSPMLPHNPPMAGVSTPELNRMINGVATDVPPLLTPGTMGIIGSMWTPSMDAQFGTAAFSTEPSGYFDNAISMVNSGADGAFNEGLPVPMAPDSPQQDMPEEPSNPPDSAPAPGAEPKKKRRARKKKVRTEEEEMRNRENFLERNRKAAQKCRQRKKVWMEDVQMKKEAASELMNILGMEVIHLVDEVTHLRAFAEEHKHCEKKRAPTRVAEGQQANLVTTGLRKQLSPITTSLEPRRDSDASLSLMTATTLDDGSLDDVEKSPVDSQWGDLNDPCWKLALEAQRRFAECNPHFVPNMPLLFGRGDDDSQRSTSLINGEDFVSPRQSGSHTDSGFSESGTPHDDSVKGTHSAKQVISPQPSV